MRGRRAWVLAVCVAVGISLVASLLVEGVPSPSAVPALAANRVTYRDRIREDPAALDIESVVVASDDRGLLAFEVRFDNRRLRPAVDCLLITIDTDASATTGAPANGVEWVLAYRDGEPKLSVYFEGAWAAIPAATASLRATTGDRNVTLRVDARTIVSPAGIRFVVESHPAAAGAEVLTVSGSDRAPDGGMWRYSFRTKVPPALTAGPVVCRPDPPRAGRTLVASMVVHVARGGVPEPLGGAAKVFATAAVGSKRIAATLLPGSRSGRVSVSFRVPAGTRGAVLRGTVRVTLEGVSIRRTFVERVA